MNDPKNDSFTTLFEDLLKSPLKLIEQIRENKTPRAVIAQLLIISLIGFLVFGVTLGSFSFHEQLWAAPLKIFIGITASTLICLPSLYVFAALTGTTLGLREIAQGMAGVLALIASLLLGFTPVLWVFSQSTKSESFFGFLVLLKQSGTTKTAPLRIWIGIFLLVTLQMSTTLRPIIGHSDQLFTSEKRFFLEHWGFTMSSLSPSTRSSRTEKSTLPVIESTEPQEQSTHGATEENPFLNDSK